jgi:hypothetical protein
VNPVGKPFTNRNRASRFVKSGRARWVDANTIEFVRTDRRHVAVAASQRRVSEIGYDQVKRTLSLEEMANIPIIAPWKLLIERSRRPAA